MNDMAVISSWSGGKDSCLAMYKALNEGYRVKYLLNFVSTGSKRGCFHGIESRLMKAQADALGIPVVQREAGPDMGEYEKVFKAAVNELQVNGVQGMVFGDIYLDEHRSWVERVCKDLDIRPIEPLWERDTEKIVTEFIDAGFSAVVVSAKAELLGSDILGRMVDRELLGYLKERNICPCGENGEFHTFVCDGPVFNKRIRITRSEPLYKDGFWKHWFLDIKDFNVEEKQPARGLTTIL